MTTKDIILLKQQLKRLKYSIRTCRRLGPALSSISGRYPDIALTTSDFAKNVQQALDIVQNQSQIEPVRASALNKEILVLLRSCNDILAQNRANIPNDLQPIIEKVHIGSQSSARYIWYRCWSTSGLRCRRIL